jgi:hypothetical protein
LGKEPLHPGTSHQLWNGTGKAERVRQPSSAAANAKPRLEVTLAKRHLSNERFSGRHIAIMFDPGTPNGFKKSLLNLGFDCIEERRVKLRN